MHNFLTLATLDLTPSHTFVAAAVRWQRLRRRRRRQAAEFTNCCCCFHCCCCLLKRNVLLAERRRHNRSVSLFKLDWEFGRSASDDFNGCERALVECISLYRCCASQCLCLRVLLSLSARVCVCVCAKQVYHLALALSCALAYSLRSGSRSAVWADWARSWERCRKLFEHRNSLTHLLTRSQRRSNKNKNQKTATYLVKKFAMRVFNCERLRARGSRL